MKKVYFVRHGESQWNVEDKICGVTDSPLTEKGQEQAAKTGMAILEAKIHADIILYSPLQRAADTALKISEITGIPAKEEPRLIEQDFGRLEGVDRFAAEFQDAKREFFARYPGGESYFDIAARVYPLLEELDGKNALLVTHGGICRVIRSYFEDLGNEEFVQFSQGNCELAKYI